MTDVLDDASIHSRLLSIVPKLPTDNVEAKEFASFYDEWTALQEDFIQCQTSGILEDETEHLMNTVACSVNALCESLLDVEDASAQLDAALDELDASISLPPTPPTPISAPTSSPIAATRPTKMPYTIRCFQWLLQNLHNPYPSDEIREVIRMATGCKRRDLDNWFTDIRKRIGWIDFRHSRFSSKRQCIMTSQQYFTDADSAGKTISEDIRCSLASISKKAQELYDSERDMAQVEHPFLDSELSTSRTSSPAPSPPSSPEPFIGEKKRKRRLSTSDAAPSSPAFKRAKLDSSSRAVSDPLHLHPMSITCADPEDFSSWLERQFAPPADTVHVQAGSGLEWVAPDPSPEATSLESTTSPSAFDITVSTGTASLASPVSPTYQDFPLPCATVDIDPFALPAGDQLTFEQLLNGDITESFGDYFLPPYNEGMLSSNDPFADATWDILSPTATKESDSFTESKYTLPPNYTPSSTTVSEDEISFPTFDIPTSLPSSYEMPTVPHIFPTATALLPTPSRRNDYPFKVPRISKFSRAAKGFFQGLGSAIMA